MLQVTVQVVSKSSLYKWSSMYKNGTNENGQNINAIIRDRHDCVVYKRIARSSELSAGVLLRSSSIILEHVLYIVIVYYFRISWIKQMYKHVALAVLWYTECLKVIVHYPTRVYQTQICTLPRNCQKHVCTQLRHATMSISQIGHHS